MKQRVHEITEGLRAIHPGWPFFIAEIESQIQRLTLDLVNQNNDETRGRIKALVSVRDLPTTLDQEREALIAALSEEDAASGLPEQSDPKGV